ncbi:uncharacterized protein [Temnothorax longispinosus]|uniref:uncharacterized protein n=1 Tax=Temnothorax longispinosus TaxID=300112 RepID=UPI003A99A7C8
MPQFIDSIINISQIITLNVSANMFNLSSMFQGLKGIRKGIICQLFRATDFVSLMYPCFSFCRILGIFPYKINVSTIKASKQYYILSTIIMCVFCTIQLKILYEINTSNNIAFKNIGTPKLIERNFFNIIGGFEVVITFILSGPRMRFLQNLLELSLKLPAKSYQNLSRLIHAKDIFGFLFMTVQLSTFFYNMQFSIVRKIHILYVFLVELQMDMLYMNCVCILKACFKQINDNLANLREIKTKGEPYLLNGTYHKQRIPFLLMMIIALKKQHLAVSDTVQMLKMVFSLQLLSTLVMTFTQITFNLYFYLVQIKGDVSMSNQERQLYLLYFIITAIYYCIKIMSIVWACETGKNQAMEINSTVHDVFNTTSNKQIKYELQLFSLQLSHCKNTFSAKGVTVDATLLTAMTGGITTYILFLIQFLSVSNSCNENL